ncbi:sensor histidine kinase [Kitasatospora sp. NPDC101176]|uniref:sensor histidine kinase n=1 Tax=Kitasatospora sp. NPDC101176 TaxID=3364099 RepID=UPI00381A4B16
MTAAEHPAPTDDNTRPRRRLSLRARLLISSISLIAVVCALIGSVAALVVHRQLYGQLDHQLGDALRRAVSSPPGPQGGQGFVGTSFLLAPGQPPATLGAVLTDGRVHTSGITSGATSLTVKPLTTAQIAALEGFAKTPELTPKSLDLPGVGTYRVELAHNGRTGDTIIMGLPTDQQQDVMDGLVAAEISVSAAVLLAAALASVLLTGSALRPLRRVAATATRVSELELHRGEVVLHERVQAADTDPRTEVGQVGAALNRLLGHVASALEARHTSEARVRQFVADASHELRTPLASIRGYAELSRRGHEEIGPDTRHVLGRIESEAARMSVLVEDLLLLARLDAGRPLSMEALDLAPLVVDCVSDARAAGPEHHWRLDLPDDPALVLGDQARLHQVLANLLANARNHTPPGTTVIARVARAGPWVLLHVADDGPGIPPELQPHVFERFARGDAARSRHAGSTGLGLAIVDAVVAAHAGEVAVRSEAGRTVFTVRLPAIG